MKTNLLLPCKFKRVGWIILIPTAILGILMTIDGYNGIPSFLLPKIIGSHLAQTLTSSVATDIANNIVLIGIILGCLFVTCSREKIEDEFISKIRLDSLLIALISNYTVVIIASLFVYNLPFLYVMICNLFTMLLIFLLVFRYKLWLLRKEVRNEE